MKQESKDAIFDGVLELMENESILDISVSKLKRHTGLSTGTFYYHFPNGIEDIFRELFIKLTSGLRKKVFSAAYNSSSVEETLESIVVTYFDWHQSNIRESNFFWVVSESGFSQVRELMVSEYKLLSSKVYEILDEQAGKDDVKIVGHYILDAILFGAAREFIHSWIERGRKKKEINNLKEEFINTLYRACIQVS